MNTKTAIHRKSKLSTAYMTRIGVLGAIAAVLFFWPEIPIIPPIYKLDFSNIPALLAGFSMGPIPALLVVLIKDLSGLFHSSSSYVGELADLLMSGSFVVCASIIYARKRTFKGALLGMVLGTAVMAVVGALSNYYIMIPFYLGRYQMTDQGIIAMVAGQIPAVDSMWKLILFATVPFNLIKGVALCLVTLLIYKRLSPLLHVKK